MTTLNAAKERIYSEFITEWGTTSVFTFDSEKTPVGFPPKAGDWARVSVRHDSSVRESLGPVGRRKYERGGSVFIQCFAPLAKGVSRADNLATVARTVFEGKTLSPEGVRFTDVVVREIGPDEGWYMINVEALFTYSETK